MYRRLFAIMMVFAMVLALAPAAYAGDAPPPEEPPPAEPPPAEDPPAEDPPAEDPPAEDPPAEDPPAEDPPAEDPPAEDPPVEDPPAFDPKLTFEPIKIEENSGVGTVVGAFGLENADPEATYRVALVSGGGDQHNALFKIVDGNVVTAAMLDFEVLGRQLKLRLAAIDTATEEIVVARAFKVTLKDAGDVILDPATVAENVPTGTVVGALGVSDDNGALNFSLTTGGGHRHNHLFDVVGGELVTAGSLDFERLGGSLTVRVAASDNGGTVLYENSVTISLTDIVDVVVVPDDVDENVEIGTIVGEVSVVGDDSGVGYAFELAGGFGDAHNDAFVIVDGHLVTATEMDFETMGASLSVRVAAIDPANGDAVYVNAINIGINDLDDEDPEIDAVEQEIIDALRPTCDPYGDDFIILRFPQLDPESSWHYSFGNDREGGERRHRGADIFGEKHSPVVAVADGVVVRYGTGTRAGHYVVVEHEGGWETIYIHLNNDTVGTDDGELSLTDALAPGISPGTEVEAGQVLGWVGDSGNAEGTSAHTHFEMWDNDHLADPHACLDQAWKWQQRVNELGDSIL